MTMVRLSHHQGYPLVWGYEPRYDFYTSLCEHYAYLSVLESNIGRIEQLVAYQEFHIDGVRIYATQTILLVGLGHGFEFDLET